MGGKDGGQNILLLPTEVDNVVDTILFLLSDRSSMTTGSTVPVDGGFLVT